MDTVSNVATQAVNLVWGDSSHQREPISGAQGNVSSGEPYDAGNMDQQSMSKVTGSNPNISTTSNADVAGDQATHKPVDTRGESVHLGAQASEPSAERRQATEDRLGNTAIENGSGVRADTSDNGVSKKTHISENDQQSKTTEGGESKSMSNNAEPEDEDDPNTKVMGEGPKPLEVVAKEHGGDAGNRGDAKEQRDGSTADDAEASQQENKGTGEMHVMTTGFAADGGDFDAAKPGAAREADRLMEEKTGSGFDNTSGGNVDGQTTNADGKPSLGERIKNKLHKH
ncbi:hypothetical protein CDD80_3053 [Ophiocordyceps camponoti-rufipedis]|uniref:Glycine-rich cell wall structural protein 1 n=1 Tax=Ophiocordyceps camponoti-rufipedis TaxID=2004952 RepID=A0A2C5Z473_9HYPO|nr:hypothetical protein CDD80_3053 [Ophiocordyceps camponoti-rufipedis]